jgi:catechol 2,3-dioxygenase-like lactoylglutathione lyase family enzyme
MAMQTKAEVTKSEVTKPEAIKPEAIKPEVNVQQAVPFLGVTSMEASLRFYVDGLGFVMTKKWTPDGPDKVRWCWLEIGSAALMLQEFKKDHHPNSGRPEGKLGMGVSVCFQCVDALALYREFRSRGIEAKTPFVGNAMWVTAVEDPDGYHLDFESPTDVAEETVYSQSIDSSGVLAPG